MERNVNLFLASRGRVRELLQVNQRFPIHARLRMEQINAHTEKYPSWKGDKLAPCVVEDDSYKEEAKRKYTVAIPYNKGSYQVVPVEDLEHIGK